MTLQAVFIDFGNTLTCEKPSRQAIYAEAARGEGLAISDEAMRDLMRRAHAELPREVDGAWRYSDPWFERFIERVFHEELGLARDRLGPLSERLFARFAEPETFALFPGAHGLLDGLRELGLVVGLVSNWSPHLARLVDALDLATRVDFVLSSAVERCEKPGPEIFEHALARAGVSADRALHAGDDVEKDFLGARRAGLRSVLVDHDRTRGDLHRPLVHDLEELGELVRALCRA